MTAFEDLERGDIIWASDPLSEKGRPMLILGAPQLPNHGTQLITVLLSTKTYHEEALPLRDDDYEGDPLGKRNLLPSRRICATLESPHYLQQTGALREGHGLPRVRILGYDVEEDEQVTKSSSPREIISDFWSDQRLLKRQTS